MESTNPTDSSTSSSFSGSTKEGTNLEEGIPQDDNGLDNRGGRLSKVSKLYDVNGDGKLDEAEQAMRDMDKENLGYLTNDKVYKLVHEQMRAQKELLNAKRLTIFFGVFALILALATLGTAFAAAELAKDTKTENNVLVVKGSGEVVATNTHGDVIEIVVDQPQDQRDLQAVTDSSSTTVSKSDAQSMYNACKNGGTERFTRTWTGYPDLEESFAVCDSSTTVTRTQNNKFYTYNLPENNKQMFVDCNSNPCTVSGPGFLQYKHELCIYDADCDSSVPKCTEGQCPKDMCGAFCSCNPEDNAGCTSPYECFTGHEMDEAEGGFVARHRLPDCKLPLGASCTSRDDCVSYNCNDGSGVCEKGTSPS